MLGRHAEANVGQTIVVRPIRFIAGKNLRAVEMRNERVTLVRVPENEPFWVLNSGNEDVLSGRGLETRTGSRHNEEHGLIALTYGRATITATPPLHNHASEQTMSKAAHAHPELFIGTSGYSYPDWKGKVYPPSLKKIAPTPVPELTYLSRYLNTCEINATFYRHFEPDIAKRWSDAVENPGFEFATQSQPGLHARGRHTPQRTQRHPPPSRPSATRTPTSTRAPLPRRLRRTKPPARRPLPVPRLVQVHHAQQAGRSPPPGGQLGSRRRRAEHLQGLPQSRSSSATRAGTIRGSSAPSASMRPPGSTSTSRSSAPPCAAPST